MALDPVPWFVGAGARHSAAAARNLAWNATGGKTGIATPTSLQVKQTSTPGGNVQIMPGGCVIESTYQGALQQSYAIRNASAVNVEIPPNTTGSTQTHYVTVEVNDPTYAGDDPPSVADGPYNRFQVRMSRQSIHPEHLLAVVRVPPNTSVITDSMITDKRELANPRREEYVFGRPRVAGDSGSQQKLNAKTSNGGEYFPGGGGSPNIFTLTVPEWATRVMIDASWMSIDYAGGTNPYGHYWVEFGDEYRDHTWPNKQQYEFATQQFGFNSPGSSNNAMRDNWLLMDALPVATKLRGKECRFAFKAGYSDGSGKGAGMDALGGLGCRVTFVEQPESTDIV